MKNLYLLFFLLNALTFIGQDHDYISANTNFLSIKQSWGEFNKIKKGYYGKELVYENEKQLFLLDREDKNIDLLFFQIPRPPVLHLSCYDAVSFKKTNETAINLPQKKGQKFSYKYMKLLEVEGELILFFNATNQKKTKVKILVQKLDSLGNTKGDLLELDEAGSLDAKGLFSRKKLGGFSVMRSPNKKVFAVVRYDPTDEDQNKKMNVKVFNGELKKVWSGKIEMDDKEKYYTVHDFKVDDSGCLYLLGKKWLTTEKIGLSGNTKTKIVKAKKATPNYNFTLMAVNTVTNSTKEYRIDLKNNFITDIKFSFLPCQDSIQLAGFYSNEPGDEIQGVFTTLINNAEQRIVHQKKKTFSKQFFKLFDEANSINTLFKKADEQGSLKNFRLDNFVIKKDGSSIITAEKYFVQVSTSHLRDASGYLRTTRNYTYHYDEIVVVYFNPQGEVQWWAKVPKRQVSHNDGGPFSSYVLNVNDHKLDMIFNDHRKNIARVEEGENLKNIGNIKKSNTIVVSIDNAGNMSRNILFSAKTLGFVFRPKSSWYPRDPYHSKKLYLFGLDYGLFKRSQFKLGSLEF